MCVDTLQRSGEVFVPKGLGYDEKVKKTLDNGKAENEPEKYMPVCLHDNDAAEKGSDCWSDDDSDGVHGHLVASNFFDKDIGNGGGRHSLTKGRGQTGEESRNCEAFIGW